MELKETKHSYYCHRANYYVGNLNGENYGRSEYDTWADFKDAWFFGENKIDHDYNHCFRFDIEKKFDENDEPTGEFSLYLFMILQRKGIFRPVVIRTITQDDMPEIEEYLKSCWRYLRMQWSEFSGFGSKVQHK